jgi:hypothetical protein
MYQLQDGYVFEMFIEPKSIYWMGLERRDVSSRYVPLFIPGTNAIAYGSEPIGTKLKITYTPYLINLETGQEY